MTQEVIQFSGDVWYGPGRVSTTCLTGRWVTPLSGTPSPRPLNNSGTKVSLSAVSTGPKASPMPGVTRCKHSYSCWSEFYSPAYADCKCLQEIPSRISTDSDDPMIFSASHVTLYNSFLSQFNPIIGASLIMIS